MRSSAITAHGLVKHLFFLCQLAAVETSAMIKTSLSSVISTMRVWLRNHNSVYWPAGIISGAIVATVTWHLSPKMIVPFIPHGSVPPFDSILQQDTTDWPLGVIPSFMGFSFFFPRRIGL